MEDPAVTWHTFDVYDRSTYPTVNAPVEVKHADGKLEKGNCREFFPQFELLSDATITSWRYIKDGAIS